MMMMRCVMLFERTEQGFHGGFRDWILPHVRKKECTGDGEQEQQYIMMMMMTEDEEAEDELLEPLTLVIAVNSI